LAVAESQSLALQPARVVPNPVTDGAVVSFQLRKSGPVSCVVYDAAGNRVASLADGFRAAGDHRVAWNAAGAEPGVYFCQLVANGQVTNTRMVRVR
jgi:hypothetical protein